MAKFRANSLCTPAIVYLVVSVALVMYIVFFVGMSALTLITKSVLIVIWTFLLNWLCSRGLSVLAWIILLLPVILVLLMACWSVDVHEGLFVNEKLCAQMLRPHVSSPAKPLWEKACPLRKKCDEKNYYWNSKETRCNTDKEQCEYKQYSWNTKKNRCNNIKEEQTKCPEKWNDFKNRCNTKEEQDCADLSYSWNHTYNRCNTNDEEVKLQGDIEQHLASQQQLRRRTGN